MPISDLDQLNEQLERAQKMFEQAEDPSEIEYWELEVLTIQDAIGAKGDQK